MAIENENGNGFYMPVAPAYNGNGNGLGFGGGWGWIVLLLLLAGNGGWGFGNGGFGGGFGFDFPWLMNGQQSISNNVSDGFRDALLNDGISGIRYNLADVSTQLCSGFAGTTAAVNNAQNSLAQQMYVNQISDLERSFAAQTASTQGMTDIRAQLAQCCCDNRIATNDLKYTIATEACSSRATSTANTQAILDKLCQLELDGYKRENDNLRSELSSARLAASQIDQTARILAGQTAEVDALYNRLNTCPIPTTPVYGRTNIFSCGSNAGCGCSGSVA